MFTLRQVLVAVAAAALPQRLDSFLGHRLHLHRIASKIINKSSTQQNNKQHADQ